MVDVKTLESFKYAEPFLPFEIELADGRHILIDRSDTIGWSEEADTVMFPVGLDGIGWTRFGQVVSVRAVKRPGRRKAS